MPHGKAAQVIAAVPEGYRVSRDGAAWLTAVTASSEFKETRKDFRRTIRATAEFLSVARLFEHDVIRPGLQMICAAVPDVSQRTVERALRWLRKQLWIGHVQRGSTERYRGVADGRGNLAAEFVRLLPALSAVGRVKSVGPSRFASQSGKLSLRAREAAKTIAMRSHPANNQEEPLRGTDSSGPSTDGNRSRERTKPTAWPVRQVPKTRRDKLVAARALQSQLPDLRRISDRGLRHLLRPLYEAGWSNADIHYALDHTPGGIPHRYGGGGHQVRHLTGWLRSRLALWSTTDGDGREVPGDSARTRRQQRADAERAAAGHPAVGDEVAPPAARAAARAAIAAVLANRPHRPAAPDLPDLQRPPKAWRR